jgi:sulfite reductase (ferredoxin)
MYKLPETLNEEIARLGELARGYQAGQVETVRFKAFRVPMGIYEQRQDEVYMVRIRATGGVITPRQLLEVIAIALRHGSDLLHITTRQEIQIQNLALEEVEPVLRELLQAGLSSKGGGGNTVRNVLVSEGSGISTKETFDTTPYALALTEKLIAEPDSCLLPRKMKIAFSSDVHATDYAAINDLGLVATIRDGQRGFKVYAGGGGGSKPTVGWTLFEFIPESELFAVAAAMKAMFSEHGNRKNKHRARIRYIFYRLGTEETLRLLRTYFEEARKTVPPYHPAPFPPNLTEAAYSPPPETDTGEDFVLWRRRYATAQRQEGRASVLVPFVLGNISLKDAEWTERLRETLRFVARFGDGVLRFTTTQNIRLRHIPENALPELFSLLRKFVPEITAPLLVNNIVSCTGADTCRLGITLSKGLAGAIRRALLRAELPGADRLAEVRIHISGCPNSCGQQLWADIGFSGKALHSDRTYPGYQVWLAASRTDAPRLAQPVGSISARHAPEFAVRLLSDWTEAADRFPSITSWLETEGRARALELLKTYAAVPDFADDKNFYFDWGAETLFSLVGRGAPECSAGLFDMIELDLAAIATHRQALAAETGAGEISAHLFATLYAAARMLLVTRGAEPKTTADAFALFLHHFIGSGLVGERFRSLVEEAKDHLSEHDYIPRKEEILALADAVETLYRNMDDSLRFKNVETAPPPPPQPAATPETPAAPAARMTKDLRGVACPMNFVHTKIYLSTMQPGEELEILLDDGAPILNVPASVRGEGHRILEETPCGDHWKVLIKKKA